MHNPIIFISWTNDIFHYIHYNKDFTIYIFQHKIQYIHSFLSFHIQLLSKFGYSSQSHFEQNPKLTKRNIIFYIAYLLEILMKHKNVVLLGDVISDVSFISVFYLNCVMCEMWYGKKPCVWNYMYICRYAMRIFIRVLFSVLTSPFPRRVWWWDVA